MLCQIYLNKIHKQPPKVVCQNCSYMKSVQRASDTSQSIKLWWVPGFKSFSVAARVHRHGFRPDDWFVLHFSAGTVLCALITDSLLASFVLPNLSSPQLHPCQYLFKHCYRGRTTRRHFHLDIFILGRRNVRKCI